MFRLPPGGPDRQTRLPSPINSWYRSVVVTDDDVQVSVAVHVPKAIASVYRLPPGRSDRQTRHFRRDQQLVWRSPVADDDVKCPSPFTSPAIALCIGCRREVLIGKAAMSSPIKSWFASVVATTTSKCPSPFTSPKAIACGVGPPGSPPAPSRCRVAFRQLECAHLAPRRWQLDAPCSCAVSAARLNGRKGSRTAHRAATVGGSHSLSVQSEQLAGPKPVAGSTRGHKVGKVRATGSLNASSAVVLLVVLVVVVVVVVLLVVLVVLVVVVVVLVVVVVVTVAVVVPVVLVVVTVVVVVMVVPVVPVVPVVLVVVLVLVVLVVPVVPVVLVVPVVPVVVLVVPVVPVVVVPAA